MSQTNRKRKSDNVLDLSSPKMVTNIEKNFRKSITREVKLEAVAYAKIHNNQQAANKYGVDRKSIRTWIQNFDSIQDQEKGSRGRRRLAETFPILEEKLYRLFQKRKKEGKKTTERWFMKTARDIHRDSGSEAEMKFTRGWFQGFRERKHISARNPTQKGLMSIADKEPLIRDYHQRVRKAIVKNGPFAMSHIANCDQTPMPFAFMAGKTYADVGDKQVWLKTSSSSENKRFCTVHLTVFADGKERVKPLIIFRGTGKRIQDRERSQYHRQVRVQFQKEAWMDEDQSCRYIVNQLGGYKEDGKLLLLLDAHPAQRTPRMKELMCRKNIIDVEIAKGCTGEVQVLDVAFNKEFKQLVQEMYDEFADDNREAMESGKVTASQKRVLITKWVAEAWSRLHPLPERVCKMVVKAFHHTGVALPIDGSRDEEIKIHGLDGYRVGDSLSDTLPFGNASGFHLVQEDEGGLDDSLDIQLSDDSDDEDRHAVDYDYSSDRGNDTDDDEIGGVESESDLPGPSRSSQRRCRRIQIMSSSESSDDEAGLNTNIQRLQSGFGRMEDNSFD